MKKKILTIILLLIPVYLLWQMFTTVRLAYKPMEIIRATDLPDKVLNALKISNDPYNTNPWGDDFHEMSSFQWIDGKQSDYELVVDKKSGGFFGNEPPKLHINGYKIILYRDFKQGEAPFILYENQLYFLVTINCWGDDIINAEFGKINMEKYIEM